MNAAEAAAIIAPYVKKSFPDDKKDIFSILTMALNKAWQEGSWEGMTKEFFVRSFNNEDGNPMIVSPKGYDTLLAANPNCIPALKRDNMFQFHKNGYGSINRNCGVSWNEDVVDMGPFPTIKNINTTNKGPAKIGVRSLGSEPDGVRLKVRGKQVGNNSIFSYETKTVNVNGSTCACTKVSAKKEETNVVYGSYLPINSDLNYICDLDYIEIDELSKDVTLNPVEVVAIYSDTTVEVLAVLDPHETTSKYRRFMVPKDCSNSTCVHGVFKVSKQKQIVNDDQPIILDDVEALISLAIGIDKMYNLGEVQAAGAYFLNGINILDKTQAQVREGVVNPIQVVSLNTMDVPEIFNRIY